MTPRVFRRCGRCGRKREFVNSGKFRINANGNLVDVWLIFKCKRCGHTWNLTVCERTRASKIPRAEYERFLQNDPALARSLGGNIALLKRNRAELRYDKE